MVGIDAIRPLVSANLTGMLRQNVDQCIRWAAYDFATRTGCQREAVNGYYVASVNQVSYSSGITGSDVFRVLSVQVGDKAFSQSDFKQGNGYVELDKPLEESGQADVTILSRPSMDADSFSDTIGERYRFDVIAGALYRGHAISGGPWFSPELSNMKLREYEMAISRAKKDAIADGMSEIDYGRFV